MRNPKNCPSNKRHPISIKYIRNGGSKVRVGCTTCQQYSYGTPCSLHGSTEKEMKQEAIKGWNEYALLAEAQALGGGIKDE